MPFLWETMDAPVVDKTGLTGVYQFTLTLPRGAMGERHIRELASGRLSARASVQLLQRADSQLSKLLRAWG
jgi:uncharacterized protein (TIGR03435 family)